MSANLLKKYGVGPGKVYLSIVVATFLILPVVSGKVAHQVSLSRRTYLQHAGVGTFFQYPFWGSGMQTVTRYVEKFSNNPEVVRFTQPPHHVIVVLLAETGVIGLVLFLLLLHGTQSNHAWIGLAPICALDHYVWTLWPGLLLASMYILLLWQHDSFNLDSLSD